MSDNTNVHRVVGNLLVGTSHFYVDTSTNKVGVTTSNPEAGLHVNSNAYVDTDFRVGADIAMNVTSGRITAGEFDGDGSLLSNINSDSGSWVNGTNSNVHLATSTDKVGVGTEDPDATLHVVGNAYVSSNLTVSGNVEVGTANLFVDTENSRVGIETDDPACALDIAGEDVMIRGNTPSLNFSEGTNGMDGSFRIHYDGANKSDHNNFLAIQYGTNFADTSLHCTFDGRVGCGTSNPEGKLHISTASGDANSIGEALIIGGPTDCSGNTNLRLGCHNDYAWIQSHCSEPLCLNPGGNNVGIGNSDPGAKLHIGPLDDDHLYLASANNAYGWKLDTDDQGNGAVPFRIKKRLNGSDQTILNIKNQDGYVGIGGSEIPTARLTVFNSVTSSDNSIPAANLGENTAFPVTTHLWLANKHSGYAPYWGLAVGTIWNGASYLQNLNKRSNTYYDLLLQPNGGRVAIGKTGAASGHILDVNSDEAIHIEQANTLYETKIHGGAIFIRNPSTSGGYEHMIINNHTASNTTHTTSYIQFRRGDSGNGNPIGTISGNGSTISYGGQSDYRVKENIVPMPISGLDTINNLQPKRFNFIGHPDNTYDGFIAHELQEHIPMAVTGVKDEMRGRGNVVKIDDESIIVKEDVSEPDSLEEGTKWVKLSEVPVYQNVDLSKIVTYLVKAVQELSEEDQTQLDDELTNIKTRFDEERTLHETTRTQLRNTQTELEVAKIKLLNIEARMSILEANFSKVNV